MRHPTPSPAPMRGRNFLMTPGPTNVPDRVLAAMHRPAVDLTDTGFMAVAHSCLADLARVFKTRGRVFLYAANGHGAWEAALANVVGEGDLVLAPSTGVFSWAWGELAKDLGAEIEELPSDWRSGFDPARIEERLRADTGHRIRAVLAVQTDTATSVTSDVAALRRALDACGHPALLMADVVASLGATDFRMDEWGVDVAVAGSQKALMAPPGLAFQRGGRTGLAREPRRRRPPRLLGLAAPHGRGVLHAVLRHPARAPHLGVARGAGHDLRRGPRRRVRPPPPLGARGPCRGGGVGTGGGAGAQRRQFRPNGPTP